VLAQDPATPIQQWAVYQSINHGSTCKAGTLLHPFSVSIHRAFSGHCPGLGRAHAPQLQVLTQVINEFKKNLSRVPLCYSFFAFIPNPLIPQKLVYQKLNKFWSYLHLI